MYGRTNIEEMHCAILRRSSSPAQGTSILNQGRTVDAVIVENKLIVIKEFILEGVTGSIPGNRSDIVDTIELKRRLGRRLDIFHKAATTAHLDATADAEPLRKANRDPHTDSLYILKNILHCKHTGYPMTGRLRGKKGRQVRKYAVGKGQHIPREGMSHEEVRAEPIESFLVYSRCRLRPVAFGSTRLVPFVKQLYRTRNSTVKSVSNSSWMPQMSIWNFSANS
jgi:hypothetical protein